MLVSRRENAINARLRRQGYDDETIALARLQKDASASGRSGAQRSLKEILEQKQPRSCRDAAPVDLTIQRKLRRRGPRGRLALGVRYEAEMEPNPAVRERLQHVAHVLEETSEGPRQLEFDFFVEGNWATSHQYFKTVKARLDAADATGFEKRTALAALHLICCYLPWQSYVCTLFAFELAKQLYLTSADMSRTLKLLEKVGAIARVKRGHMKVITVTPAGAYYGDIKNHDELVQRWSAEVVPIRKPSHPESVAATAG